MELFLTEHGDSLRSAITGILVLIIIMTIFTNLYGIMPVYDTYQESDNSEFTHKIIDSSPVIEGDEIVYVEFMSDFNIKDWIVAKDCDGMDITDKVTVQGMVDTTKRGLHTLYIKVIGTKGYTTRKKINVLVE